MLQPMKWIAKYKILSSFFEYLYKKNNYIRGKDDRKDAYPYGQAHCHICKIIPTANMLTIEGLRKDFATNSRKDACFNAFNLARLRACQLPLNSFNSVEKILLRELYESGRLDYALTPHE